MPAVVDGQAVASNFDGAVPVYSLEPSGEPFTPPVKDGYGPERYGESFVWTDSATHAFVNADGSPAAIPAFTLPAGWWADVPITSGDSLAAVVSPPPPVDPDETRLGAGDTRDIRGQRRRAPGAVHVRKQALRPVAWLDGDHLIVIAEFNPRLQGLQRTHAAARSRTGDHRRRQGNACRSSTHRSSWMAAARAALLSFRRCRGSRE